MGDPISGMILALLLLLSSTQASAEQRAKCRTLYPPYAFTADEAQYVSDPYTEGTWDGRMFASKHANGGDSLELLRLSINPGHGWPPHRHLSADEWIYVISGNGDYAYWALEEEQPTEISIGPGHALYNPQGQLHKVWNDGSEPLVLLSVSKALAPYEVLTDWPDLPGGGLGYVPHVAPWELTCAPGHELGEGEEEEAEEETAGFAAVGEEWRSGSGLAGQSLEGDEEDDEDSDDDYGSGSGCGCIGDSKPMSESEIAECMAEPDVFDEDIYESEAYSGEEGDWEPEFPEFGDTEQAGQPAHDEL